jgi:hypothetical protein
MNKNVEEIGKWEKEGRQPQEPEGVGIPALTSLVWAKKVTFKKSSWQSQLWWYMPIILALGRLKQGGYIMSSRLAWATNKDCLKKK